MRATAEAGAGGALDPRPLREMDPAVAASIDRELERQRTGLELIASENFVSRGVLEATGCVMTNKYAEGYPGRRYYGGCEFVDEVENLARERARRLFGADHSNVQAHSGSGANMTALQALTEPGATLLGMDLSHGGHLTHGSQVNFSGLWYRVVPYGVRASDRTIDYDALRATALEVRPTVIIAGASAYPRRIDFERFAEIAEECGARVLVDMAHIAGLVATGHHPSPVPHADVVTTTTHKTLRGPRGGLILCREEHAKAVDKAVFPGLQGGPLMHVIAAKAVALGEALRPGFGEYSDLVVRNARALGRRLAEHGYDLVAAGGRIPTSSSWTSGRRISRARMRRPSWVGRALPSTRTPCRSRPARPSWRPASGSGRRPCRPVPWARTKWSESPISCTARCARKAMTRRFRRWTPRSGRCARISRSIPRMTAFTGRA